MSAVNTILNALQIMIPSFAKSSGSIEAKIIDVVGTYADSEATERQNTLDTIRYALATQKTTTAEYYRRKSVLFQYGDILTYDPVNQGGYYSPVDTEKQIVKQAYITGSFPLYTLLVNAVGADGHLRALTAQELAAFKTYFAAFQPMGMPINILSLAVAQIYANEIIIYVRSGTDAEAVASDINANFIANESTLRSYNTVSLTEIVDIIQKTNGVVAVGLPTDIYAIDRKLDGSTVTIKPANGIFNITGGAFTFGTTITVDNIKVLQ